MKKNMTTFLFFFIVLFAFTAQGQPFELAISTADPDDTMNITINGDFTFDSGECMLMGLSVNPQGNDIYATASFGTGILPENCNSLQDFQLGTLPAGDYNFICEVVEFQFDPEASCYVVAQSQIVEMSFTVASSMSACSITEIITDPAECDGNGTYSLFLNFAYEGNTNEFFDVYSGEELLGFYAYADLPITIANFPERVTSDYDIITICDNDNPDCCTTHEFMGPDCTVAECSISNVFAEAHACSGDNVFYVDIEFTAENPGMEGFQIVGNGQNYGTFGYGETFYTFGPIEGNGQVLEFIIQDLSNPECSDFTVLTAPVCETSICVIHELIVEPYACNPDGTYDIDLAFTYENVGGVGFDVFVNDEFHSFQTTYPNPFITIENFGIGDGETIVVSVNDNDNLDCAAVYTFVEPNCVTPTCSISEVSLTATDCEEGQFYIVMDFIHDTNSGAFIVGGAGSGQYNYADLPITLGPFEGNGQGMVFEVVDSEFGDCFAVEDILAPTCSIGECMVENVVATPTACESNATFFVEISFTANNPGAEGFQILGNGNNYGTFDYGAASYMVGPLFGDGTTVYEFVIQDLQYPDCSAFTVIDPVDCTMNFGEISNIVLTPHDCDEEQSFMIELDFDYTNVSDEFTLKVNSVSEGSFPYETLPVMVGPYLGDGQTNYEFIISDPGANTSAGAELLALDCGFGTGVEEIENGPQVRIFNPNFSEELHLRISDITNDEMQVRLFDAIGQLVYFTKGKQNRDAYTIDLTNYAVGMYICELRIGTQRYVGKFMQQ